MSLQHTIIPVTPLRQNCTIFWCDETNIGVVIDPGGDAEMLNSTIQDLGITIDRILLTHGHFDHVGGAMDLNEATKAPIIGPHVDDAYLIQDVANIGKLFDVHEGRDVVGNAWVNDGDVVKFGNITLNVIHTPGHTPGHVVYYASCAKLAQVGDVIFKGSIGRTDFPGGDMETLLTSITTKLWPLGNDTTFIPGHGPTSTFGTQRANNPFVGDDVMTR